MMVEIICEMFKVQPDFELEVWVSIYDSLINDFLPFSLTKKIVVQIQA